MIKSGGGGQCRHFQEKLPHFNTEQSEQSSYIIRDENRELKLTMKLRTEMTCKAKKQKNIIGKSPSVAESSV